ncbi:hypothetical protein [Allomuricauda sp. CP2A]|jgi:hypothetical protein|uniref:hypothetical protein n=1 Tax=Allomuricauda sp. CP2A TaxID=1848189 RepID=UPI0008337CCB|nr:hypothetical protein [Muricauda sp. CP2A]
MKTKFLFLLTAFISLSLISCIDGKKKNSDSPINENDFFKINVDNDYSIRIPRDMQKTTGLNSDAPLQYQNIYKEVYTIVIDEPKKEFVDAMKELGHEEKSTLAFYRDIQSKRLVERMDITNQSKPTPMHISGLEAEALEIDAKVDNIEEELTYFLTFLEGENKIYMIMSWTLKSKKKEYKKTFETIAQSFEVKD